MKKNLSNRPNLDHLRRQAKDLLSALRSGDADAVATFQKHLPSAAGMAAAEVRTAEFRLADAQSAIARKTGFAGWPALARHVELLRALEGTWAYSTLEVGGQPIPPGALLHSRLLIDGDRFRTESPGAIYEGVFNIDVEAEPHHIDIEFVEGPEAGNANYGVFRVEADRLEICLDLTGKRRPTVFRSAPGSQEAFETLTRTSPARPESVTGGAKRARAAAAPAPQAPHGFDYAPSETLSRLQGEWSAVSIVRDGMTLPATMCQAGRRLATKNQLRISFSGKVIIEALVRIDESANPVVIDYYNTGGEAFGTVQRGIMKWNGDNACFCMAAPGGPRPSDFECPSGSGRTLSEWRPGK